VTVWRDGELVAHDCEGNSLTKAQHAQRLIRMLQGTGSDWVSYYINWFGFAEEEISNIECGNQKVSCDLLYEELDRLLYMEDDRFADNCRDGLL
jgi:hypothetical protein